MRDEMEARMWVEHGQDFSKSVSELFAKLKPALDRIHAYHFAAPWRQDGSASGPGQA